MNHGINHSTMDPKLHDTVDVVSLEQRVTDDKEHGAGEPVRVLDHKLERRICWKFDIRILPLITVMYLFNALDKGNISNAKTDKLDVDLGIKGQQWNNMLSIFYIPFVLCAFPLSLLIKRYNAANVIPCLITFYRRGELARRLSIFYAAANIANAFSGLLAFGLFQIKTERLHGWQILFLVEGGATVIVAVFAFFYLPRTVEKAAFLTEEERECAIWRIRTDSSSLSTEKVSLMDAIKVFKHPVAIAWMFEEIFIGVPLNSINNWFPQIIESLGKGTVMTNLYTVAPNVWGAVALIFWCFASDLLRVRSIFIVLAVASTLIGFVVFGCIDTQAHIGVAYFSCFLMTTGSSASSVLTSTWYNNNTPNENRRVVISAVGVPLANAAGLISTNIFRAKDAPKYVPALGITAGFGGAAIIAVTSILTFMVLDNRRRNRAQGVSWTYRDVPTYLLAEGPSNPNYRWMY
ncbi:D-galactonate transporter [Ogataea parapolymorpha DL-1]|uniref:D-galactonate transporter n=1 Tax=Ogataea parapolymorpha (strain ATCC 26012 / BCRC 20466 / JCM 22074 / NRRL Y-7560 / DL-1) TaxID=871575 RepID=W1QHE1_OGAPD|nr:D-galactonate transporter [Ogataea parapolymorpha DL-1]ESX01477.1 D-galactonate transporter [Ogataea parapolymorpha DL-1]